AEKHHAETSRLHAIREVLKLFDCQPRLGDGSALTRCPLMRARSTVRTSKSFVGRICRKMSAALALGVSRMSTRIIVRPLRPFGTNLPFWVSVYFVKCRGWHSAGLPPQ